jgi:hypothetical protein
MVTSAIAAFGVTLTRDTHAIAEITNLSAPELSLDTLDVTSHDSPNKFREYIATVLDGGEVTLEGNFLAGDTNGQVALLSDMLAKTKQAFVMTFPTEVTATWTFSAYVTKFKAGDFPVDGKVPFSASLKITSKPTLAIGASTGLTTTFFSISGSAVIVPAPANAVYEYVATVLTGVSSVTITPIAAAGVITVNGNVVGTGVPSSAITLGAAGSITDITIVVTETGKVPKTYVIHVARASS